jgi:cell fate regulator YaaT (PSP1 superfamily)
MDTLYEVLYRRPYRTLFFLSGGDKLALGDEVVLGGEHGVGQVVWKGRGDPETESVIGAASVRKASNADQDRALDLRQKERAALEIFQNKISEHGLPMKSVEVTWEADGSRITFYFTADHRVDFRELVRDLASIYRRRIELRQINPRKETQMLGGCGACGRALCCSSFLETPQPVSAKEVATGEGAQNLSKLVGVCGQLKCCLRYENQKTKCCSGCGNNEPLATQPATL